VCLSTATKICSSQEAKAWLLKAEQSGHKNASQLLRLLATQKQPGNVSYIETIPLNFG
jgi:TPR repeat protein